MERALCMISKYFTSYERRLYVWKMMAFSLSESQANGHSGGASVTDSGGSLWGCVSRSAQFGWGLIMSTVLAVHQEKTQNAVALVTAI
jgi:hypothetical protein